MNWNNIIHEQRTGYGKSTDRIRTGFQRDYDRLIFSSAFRRLQNKTQIFALPGTAFVHNRLTHSLETASVGRSLGKSIGTDLIKANLIDDDHKDFYRYELPNVIAAACLAHDIGNPPFGHSGEEAISHFFIENENLAIEGKKLKNYFNKAEWYDLIHFEGNANSLRILTHNFQGKPHGGYRLTYTTLAAMMKYPCTSEVAYSGKGGKSIHKKKYSVFQAEMPLAKTILDTLNISSVSKSPMEYKRHPFVYLTEAADDICYRIVDFEDAHRLGILEYREVEYFFVELIQKLQPSNIIDNTQENLQKISDHNEKISYLRAKAINLLTMKSANLFVEHQGDIIQGKLDLGLVDLIQNEIEVLGEIAKISWERIYNHHTVVQLEVAGFRVMSDMLSLFLPAILKKKANKKDQKFQYLIPKQFLGETEQTSPYEKTLLLLDYFSGMTDLYIIDLYRKLFGIEIPIHKG